MKFSIQKTMLTMSFMVGIGNATHAESRQYDSQIKSIVTAAMASINAGIPTAMPYKGKLKQALDIYEVALIKELQNSIAMAGFTGPAIQTGMQNAMVTTSANLAQLGLGIALGNITDQLKQSEPIIQASLNTQVKNQPTQKPLSKDESIDTIVSGIMASIDLTIQAKLPKIVPAPTKKALKKALNILQEELKSNLKVSLSANINQENIQKGIKKAMFETIDRSQTEIADLVIRAIFKQVLRNRIAS